MQQYSKKGSLVFNGLNASGNPIPVENSESAIWAAETENNIALLFASNAGGLNGAIVKSSLSDLNGDLAHAADKMAWVVGDSTQGNDGVYQKQGATGAGSWTRLADLPYSVIQINNADAGTANAIQATSAVNIPNASYGALLVLNITAANTGTVTLSVNGGTAKPLVTNTNAPIASGYLVSGMAVLCVDDGTSYRLFSYGDASAVQSAAEAAQLAAENARDAALAHTGSLTDASGITYLNSGTGALSQTLQARLGYQVLVTDFGAVGDDSTDNQDEFEAAIAHVSSQGGGVVRVPEGTFRISDELTLPARVSMIGEGQDSAIRTTSATAAILVPSGNQFIQDLAFQTAVTRTATDGVIEMDGVGEIFIHRCRFNSHLYSINIKNACSLIWITKNIIYKAGATSEGISITGPTAVGNDYFIRDNLIKSLDPNVQGSYGIYIDRSGGTYMSGNSVLQSGTPFKLKAASGTELTWTFSSNDVFDTSSGIGVDIEAESGGTIKGVTFTTLWSSSNGQDGVKIHGAGTIDGVDFTDPQIKNNSFYGILVDSGINVSINGGVVTGNSGASSGTYHAINFSAGVSKFSVVGTFAGAGHGFGASQGYGVVVQSGASDNYTISLVKGWGNVTGTVLDLGTGTNKFVGNNSGDTASAVSSSPSFPFVIFDGTTGTILESEKVSALSRTATGKYTVTFESGAFANANYMGAGSAQKTDANDDGNINVQVGGASGLNQTTTTGYIRVLYNSGTTFADSALVGVYFFGGQ